MNAWKPFIAALAPTLGQSVLANEPVDINSAGPQALAEAIDGVGLKRAQAIIVYREQNGPFDSVDQLVNVQGIGPKIVENSRGNLTTGK